MKHIIWLWIFPALICTIDQNYYTNNSVLCVFSIFHIKCGKLPFQSNINCFAFTHTHIYSHDWNTYDKIVSYLLYGRQNWSMRIFVLVNALSVYNSWIVWYIQSFSECCRIRSLKLNLVTNLKKKRRNNNKLIIQM